jgi:Bacterial protein of unknown function (DUF882)
MDPHLFDILWEVYRASGSSAPIHVVSAYRSPGTNDMLRRRSRGVAKNSQHMSGKALDFNFPDVSMSAVRDIGLRLQHGGVGYYPRANNPWVHLDTGGVRHWPKVTRDHLVRLFPDEKTVHIPRDGKPLSGFESARSIIEARGGAVSSGYIQIAEGRATGKSLFQILFGGGEGDDEDVAPTRGRGGRTVVASRSIRPSAPAPQQADEGGSALAFFAGNNQTTTTSAPAAITRPTRPTPIPEPRPAAETRPAEVPRQAEEPKPTQVAALAPRATPAKPEEEAVGRLVNIPLPPRRPSNLNTQTEEDESIGRLVNIPLPPRRPANLVQTAALAPEPAKADQPRADDSRAEASRTEVPKTETPREEPRQQQVGNPGRLVNIPLPPARPSNLNVAAAPVQPRREPATPVTALAAAPPPPAAPAAITSGRIVPAAPAQQAAAAPGGATQPDRKAMTNLIAQTAIAATPTSTRATAPTVSAIAAPRMLSGRFERPAPVATQPVASASGFSGSAIRPIGQGLRKVDE